MKSKPKEVTILLIDDNEDIRTLITLILEKARFNVISAIDGVDGLQKTSEFSPDLILLDSMMPILSGVEVLSRIREDKDPKINAIPIVMLTSRSSVEDIDIAIDLGATSYIVKPFRPQKLIEKIITLLKSEGIFTSASET